MSIERFSQHPLVRLLDRFIISGSIDFLVGSHRIRVGADRNKEMNSVVRVNDVAFLDRALYFGNLGLGEAYIKGEFDIEDSNIAGFLGILLKNNIDKKVIKGINIRIAMKSVLIKARNKIRGRFKNIHHHFDIGNDLYESFLDTTLAYTCGYVTDSKQDLDAIQVNKYRRIMEKIDLQPGDRLADVGCGYGGLLIYAAKNYGVTGKGLTISKNQCDKANELIFKEGLAENLSVEYASYETLSGVYDKIVSIGMMEHLRNREYSSCINRISKQLTPEGRGLIHFIGSNGVEGASDPFTQKYIFPGAHWPRLSTIVREIENSGLCVLDIENMARHYTVTLQLWLERFRLNYVYLDHRKYDEEFRRMWEYYLGCAIASSLMSPVGLFQILFQKDCTSYIPYRRV